jgi:beta-galactosidase GanA
LRRAFAGELPEGVTAQLRATAEREFLFLLNATDKEQHLSAEPGFSGKNLLDGASVGATLVLGPYGVLVIERGA